MQQALHKQSDSDFSLVLGGPLYQLFLRSRLARDPLDLLYRRLLFFFFVTWVPLLFLSWFDGNLYGGSSGVPFLFDFSVQVRLLFTLPLLIGSEIVVHKRTRSVIQQFFNRGIITQNVTPQFEAAVGSAMRLRNSIAVEIGLILFVLAVGHQAWSHGNELTVATWFAAPVHSLSEFTAAGKWYMWVSMPIFQFILLRCWFRFIIWTKFLWQVSRLPLKLIPTHPDCSAGLGFLAQSVYGFFPILIAQGALLSGMIGNRIFHDGAVLTAFKVEIAGYVALVVFMVIGPLCVFLVPLLDTKRRGRREYGKLASRYVEEFDEKWLRGGAPSGEPLIGSADIQSLADLTSSVNVVQKMRLVPFSKEVVLSSIVITLLPVFPLVLTMVPIEKLVDQLIGILF